MYCTGCGAEMREDDRFCAKCGQATASVRSERVYGTAPRLMRDMRDKKIGGVCAGLAWHLGWDVTLVRVAFLAAILFKGIGLWAYLIAWICMPRDDVRTTVPV